MADTTRLVTAAELETLPEGDFRYELVDGRLIRMSPVGFEHSRIVARLWLLTQHVRSANLGFVGLGCKLRGEPDTVRAPDVAFIRADRLPSAPKGFWQGPPDLAIEVRSPGDRHADIARRIDDYLSSGVSIVVLMDSEDASAVVYRPGEPRWILRGSDSLDLDDVLRGFRCEVREIFE